jgi:hypothetical protein
MSLLPGNNFLKVIWLKKITDKLYLSEKLKHLLSYVLHYFEGTCSLNMK